jgi:hypothetical protein
MTMRTSEQMVRNELAIGFTPLILTVSGWMQDFANTLRRWRPTLNTISNFLGEAVPNALNLGRRGEQRYQPGQEGDINRRAAAIAGGEPGYWESRWWIVQGWLGMGPRAQAARELSRGRPIIDFPFTSRQMDVESFESMIQTEAVRTPGQQVLFQQEMEQLREVVRILNSIDNNTGAHPTPQSS